ncbi:MAG: trypsin-like serine protease, partial [Burkholderiales bacterium]|nr:trypsin-like serine protease [Burkholderiales bacterium]
MNLELHGNQQPFDDELFKRFFGDRMPDFQFPQPRGQARATGSGFVTTPDGYVVTNHHVIADARRVSVKLSDDREFDAEVIGSDSHTDLALLKIDASGLAHVPLGDSESLEIGQWVLAIGNPFGLSGTVTSGIVSATGRSTVGINDYENYIQTDAAINPG